MNDSMTEDKKKQTESNQEQNAQVEQESTKPNVNDVEQSKVPESDPAISDESKTDASVVEADNETTDKAEQSSLHELEQLMKAEQNKESPKSSDSQRESLSHRPPISKQSDHSRITQTNKPARNWSGALAFLFSVLTLAALAVVVWFGKIELDNQKALLASKQQNLDSAQQNITQLQSQLTQIQNSRAQQLDINNQYQNNLTAISNRVKELSLSQPNYWLAAEAQFLIQLAERRLLIENDINTTIQLLIDANQRLTAMNDASVFNIREAISADIASLYAIEQPNTDDIYLSLSGLSAELGNLSFAAFMIPEPVDKEQQPEVSENVDDWQQNLAISLQRFFGNFVEITRHNQPVEPQLPPEQKWFILANIQTQLVMAQRSTLDFNQARYQDALQKVELWVKQYFDLESAKTVAFLNTIIALRNQEVTLTIPKQLSSQALITNFVNSQLTMKGDNNG